MAAPTSKANAYSRHVDFLEYCTKKLCKLLNSEVIFLYLNLCFTSKCLASAFVTKPLSSGAGVYYAAYINNSTSVHGKKQSYNLASLTNYCYS